MVKFTKGKFDIDFQKAGFIEKEGYHSEFFFIYKTREEWTVCHKLSNLKLTNLSHEFLKKAKENVSKVEEAFDWSAENGYEIAKLNNMTGSEFKTAMFNVLYK